MDFGSRLAEFQQHQPHPTPNPLHTDPSHAHAQLYNAPNHPHYPQSYAYAFFHPPNPPSNPNPLCDSSGPDTGLRPPGVDSYVPNPYAPHGGYVVTAAASAQYGQPQAAAAYFHDPSAQPQSWGVVDPAGFAAVVMPPNAMEQMVVANPNPMVWNGQRIHPLARGINMKRNLKKAKVVQSAWCELCKIDCNSHDILNKHKLGKRHMKNLKKLMESKNVVAALPVGTTEPQQPTPVKEITSGDGSNDKKMKRKRILASEPEEDIETKRRKLVEGGTTADSLRICTACNVVCNSETVFHLHLAGQKHAAKVASAPEIIGPMVNPSPNLNPNPIANPPVICDPQVIPRLSHPMLNGDMEKKKKKKKSMKSEVVQPFICELCKIYCSGQDILNRHNLGKRHKKNLEQFEKLKNAAAAATTAAAVNPEPVAGMNITPSEDQAKTTRGKAKSKRLDLETKKQKLLEGGTTADSVKVCTVCNVVCNSETVYKYHLAGQRHATLLKKQLQKQNAATSTSAVGPKPVSAATVTSTVGPLVAATAIMSSTV